MSVYEWLLVVHVVSAFALVAAYVVYTVGILAGFRTDRPSDAVALYRILRPADILVWIGAVGTIVFGIWLAIYVDGYEVWDPWILASIVLWAIAMETGRREDIAYKKARDLAARLAGEGRDEPSAELRALFRSRQGLLLHVTTSAAFLAILALMIFKPGAT